MAVLYPLFVHPRFLDQLGKPYVLEQAVSVWSGRIGGGLRDTAQRQMQNTISSRMRLRNWLMSCKNTLQAKWYSSTLWEVCTWKHPYCTMDGHYHYTKPLTLVSRYFHRWDHLSFGGNLPVSETLVIITCPVGIFITRNLPGNHLRDWQVCQ